MTPNPPCPCCGESLATAVENVDGAWRWIAWCKRGCKSEAAANGFTGRNAMEACQNLIERLERKPDWK